jgi:hypothetical protein
LEGHHLIFVQNQSLSHLNPQKSIGNIGLAIDIPVLFFLLDQLGPIASHIHDSRCPECGLVLKLDLGLYLKPERGALWLEHNPSGIIFDDLST